MIPQFNRRFASDRYGDKHTLRLGKTLGLTIGAHTEELKPVFLDEVAAFLLYIGHQVFYGNLIPSEVFYLTAFPANQ
jgi:hypothetical protein